MYKYANLILALVTVGTLALALLSLSTSTAVQYHNAVTRLFNP